jgi:hypothetical protein
MQNVFLAKNYQFPYEYKFPGQATDEKILFVVRENGVMLVVRLAGLALAAGLVFVLGWWLGGVAAGFSSSMAALIRLFSLLFALGFGSIGYWWLTILWKKSICIITNKRLTKFIYTTPFNRHNLSLPLDQIVDTGSYTKGFLQAVFKLGTFTARSAAASSGVASEEESIGMDKRINRKYFYIENVACAEDLQHYVAKLLSAFRQYHDYLPSFRPFIPQLKGEARKEFMKQFPDYWS